MSGPADALTCADDQQEAHSGIIEVEESAEVIAALLQHIYEGPSGFLPQPDDSRERTLEKLDLAHFHLALDLQTAADKVRYVRSIY